MDQPGVSAEQRVWDAVPADARTALESGLKPTDLQTLLLAVARARAARVTPARVLRRWREDRFTRPSPSDPRAVAETEVRLWRLLPSRFVGVELSPVAPLGACSAVAPVDQRRVVSTVRGTEVVSDSTNALAIEAAIRRADQDPGDRVDLASCHRVLRGQVFGPGMGSHFRLFALVSTARDRGSAATEAELLIDHLDFWQQALAVLGPPRNPWLTVTVFDSPVLTQRLSDTVLPAVNSRGRVPVAEDRTRTQGKGYYAGAAIGLRARDDDGAEVDLGDGGLVDWTAQFRNDAKERCLVSCVSTERLTALAGAVVSS